MSITSFMLGDKRIIDEWIPDVLINMIPPDRTGSPIVSQAHDDSAIVSSSASSEHEYLLIAVEWFKLPEPLTPGAV